MCNVGRVARAGAANLRERGQSGTVTRPSTIQCLHYNLLNIVARPPTVLCVYLLSTPNDSGRVVMRLDMVYAPSSINYNLYPPSYIPPSIQTNFVFPYSVPPTIPWTDTICDFSVTNCDFSVTFCDFSLGIKSMLSKCIQCWSQLTAQLSSEQSLTCSSQTWHSGNSTVLDRESSDKVMEGLCMGQVLFSQL